VNERVVGEIFHNSHVFSLVVCKDQRYEQKGSHDCQSKELEVEEENISDPNILFIHFISGKNSTVGNSKNAA
jgi:hypothetical protein